MSHRAGGGPPPVRALLVGIDRYERFPSLWGCVADARAVEAYLTADLHVPEGSVRKLLSPRSPLPAAGAAEEAAFPSRANLEGAFERLIAETGPAETVYLHYSGHGTRLPTAWPELKGPGAQDEALVLPAADGAEPRYLRDLEIARLLDRLAARGAAVTLVLDCCHSGGATRGAPVVAPPGGRVRGVVAPPAARDAAPAEALAATWRRLQGARRWRDLRPGGTWAGRDHVFLAACRSTERAIEYAFDGGRPRGALTHFLLATLAEGGAGLSYRRLYERLLPRLHGWFPEQTPLLDGAAERLVLGLSALPSGRAPAASPELVRLAAFDRAADHRERYRTALALANRDPASRLRGALRLALGRLPPAVSPTGPLFGVPLDGVGELRAGDWAVLGLRNLTSAELCLALFDLRPDWSIAQILPASDSGPFLHLEPGGEERVALKTSLPPGLSAGGDTLKAFATAEPADFRGLELDPLETWSAVGPPPAQAPPEALHAPPGSAAWPDWTSASVEVRIRAR